MLTGLSKNCNFECHSSCRNVRFLFSNTRNDEYCNLKPLNDLRSAVIGGKLEKKKFESRVDWNVVDVTTYSGWLWQRKNLASKNFLNWVSLQSIKSLRSQLISLGWSVNGSLSLRKNLASWVCLLFTFVSRERSSNRTVPRESDLSWLWILE